MDPLAKQTPWDSPYAYCGGDPVNRVDPMGMGIHDVNPIPGVTCTPQGNYPTANDINASLWSNDHSNPNNGDPTMAGWSASGWVNPTGNRPSQSSVPVNKDQELKAGSNTLSDAIQKYTDPKIDLTVGAAEYKVGKILTNRGVYGKLLPETIIRTVAANITVSTELLQTTGTVLKCAGVGLGAVGMVGTVVQYETGQISGAEATLDLVMGGVGFIPGYGWAVSGAYFLIAKPLYNYATEE